MVFKSPGIAKRFFQSVTWPRLGKIPIWDIISLIGLLVIFWRMIQAGGRPKDAIDTLSASVTVTTFVFGQLSRIRKKSRNEVRLAFITDARVQIDLGVQDFIDLQHECNENEFPPERMRYFVGKLNAVEQQLYRVQCIQDNAKFAQIVTFHPCMKDIAKLRVSLNALVAKVGKSNIHFKRSQFNEDAGDIIKELYRLDAILNK